MCDWCAQLTEFTLTVCVWESMWKLHLRWWCYLNGIWHGVRWCGGVSIAVICNKFYCEMWTRDKNCPIRWTIKCLSHRYESTPHAYRHLSRNGKDEPCEVFLCDCQCKLSQRVRRMAVKISLLDRFGVSAVHLI